MNLEKNDEQDGHYMKVKSFQYIVDESITLEVVVDKDRDERMLRLETLLLVKGNNIFEQPRIDLIELWFQNIIGEATQSDPQHTLFNLSQVHIESAPNSLVKIPICSIVMEFIPKIISMLEWIHWKSSYT